VARRTVPPCLCFALLRYVFEAKQFLRFARQWLYEFDDIAGFVFIDIHWFFPFLCGFAFEIASTGTVRDNGD